MLCHHGKLLDHFLRIEDRPRFVIFVPYSLLSSFFEVDVKSYSSNLAFFYDWYNQRFRSLYRLRSILFLIAGLNDDDWVVFYS